MVDVDTEEWCTHILEPILAQLPEQMQEADGREPGAPEQHLVHVLHVDDAEHEDELVEDEVPQLVLEPLRLGHAQPAEDCALHQHAEQRKRAVSDVYYGLEQTKQRFIFLYIRAAHEQTMYLMC